MIPFRTLAEGTISYQTDSPRDCRTAVLCRQIPQSFAARASDRSPCRGYQVVSHSAPLSGDRLSPPMMTPAPTLCPNFSVAARHNKEAREVTQFLHPHTALLRTIMIFRPASPLGRLVESSEQPAGGRSGPHPGRFRNEAHEPQPPTPSSLFDSGKRPALLRLERS
jgi:hypothetical protein